MRYIIIITLDFIILQGLFGQRSIEVLDTELSPKGDIELQYADDDSCICLDVWLVSQEDTTQKFMLDSATVLGTKYFFSPDENWIAANFEVVSDFRTIILFKRIKGIQYSAIKNVEIYEKALKFLTKTEHLRQVPRLDHSIAQLIRWLPSSKSFLLSIGGWDDEHGVGVKNWTCLFNVNSQSISLDENNQGKITHAR